MHEIGQRRLGKNGQTDAEGQLPGVGFGVAEVGMVAGQGLTQAGEVGRRVGLHSLRIGLLHLLQRDDVRVVAPNLRDRAIEIRRGVIGILRVPRLAKLHVELQKPKTTHGSFPFFCSWGEDSRTTAAAFEESLVRLPNNRSSPDKGRGVRRTSMVPGADFLVSKRVSCARLRFSAGCSTGALTKAFRVSRAG